MEGFQVAVIQVCYNYRCMPGIVSNRAVTKLSADGGNGIHVDLHGIFA